MRFFDGCTDAIAPLGPGAVVVADVVVAEKVGEDEPGVGGALTNAAVGDDVVIGFEAKFVGVDLFEFLACFEGVVGVASGLPWNGLGTGDVTAAQDAFLGVFRHVGEFAGELARGADVNEGFAFAGVAQGVIKKGADAGVVALGRDGVVRGGVAGFVFGEGAAFGDPLVAAAVEDFAAGVAEEVEDPEGVAGPPVGFVAVEDAGGVGGDAEAGAEAGELFGLEVVADGLVVEVGTPVDVDGTRDVTGGIEEDVFVAFDDANGGVCEVVGEPLGGDEGFGVGVLGEFVFAHVFDCSR